MVDRVQPITSQSLFVPKRRAFLAPPVLPRSAVTPVVRAHPQLARVALRQPTYNPGLPGLFVSVGPLVGPGKA